MNQSFIDVASEIEGPEFRFVANQAAGLSAFKQIVRNQPAYQALWRYITANPNGPNSVLARVRTLASKPFDTRYEHPDDAALAAYLLALESYTSQDAALAADATAKTKRLWWTNKIAREIDYAHRFRATVQTTQGHFQQFNKTNLSWRLALGAMHTVPVAEIRLSRSKLIEAVTFLEALSVTTGLPVEPDTDVVIWPELTLASQQVDTHAHR